DKVFHLSKYDNLNLHKATTSSGKQLDSNNLRATVATQVVNMMKQKGDLSENNKPDALQVRALCGYLVGKYKDLLEPDYTGYVIIIIVIINFITYLFLLIGLLHFIAFNRHAFTHTLKRRLIIKRCDCQKK